MSPSVKYLFICCRTTAAVPKVQMTGTSTYTLIAAVKAKVVRSVVFHFPVVYLILL